MIQFLLRAFVLLIMFCLFACGQNNLNINSQQGHSASNSPQRIITLAPHLTELLFSLGVDKRIIATVAYSDYPQQAQNIPRIGDAFRVDWEKLAQLKPDLILAWKGGNPQSLITELERRGYRVEKFPNASLYELPQQLRELGDLLSIPVNGIGTDYSKNLQMLMDEYENKQTIKVFYQISAQPIYSIGSAHTISEMLQVCGAKNVFSNHTVLASPLSPEAVIKAQPDLILTSNQIYPEVIKLWEKLGSMSQTNILKVPGDEVSRASLRMLQGVKNICASLDTWRHNNKPQSIDHKVSSLNKSSFSL